MFNNYLNEKPFLLLLLLSSMMAVDLIIFWLFLSNNNTLTYSAIEYLNCAKISFTGKI